MSFDSGMSSGEEVEDLAMIQQDPKTKKLRNTTGFVSALTSQGLLGGHFQQIQLI